jgi:ankyrin repeat protein
VSDLLLREKNITFVDAYGDTVLEAAAEVGNPDIILLYFSSGGIYRSSALFKAVKAALISQDTSIVLLLAMNRPVKMIDRYEASALVIAIREMQLVLVDILLGDQFLPGSVYSRDNMRSPQNGFLVDVTPLNAAIYSGNTELINKLLQVGYRARPRDLEYSKFIKSYESTASLLWSHFPPTNNDPEWTQHLLFDNVRLNRTQRVHECIACIDGLDYYIDSRTPLQEAVENGFTNTMALLIDAGADINAPPASFRGATALQLAAIKGSMNIARSLLDRGADVNAPPAKLKGRTALEGASEYGKLDMVQLLLGKGVKVDGAMRIHYIRAVAYAKKQGHLALAKLLKEFGGWIDRDQEICNREDLLLEEGYFVFDGETQDWNFKYFM